MCAESSFSLVPVWSYGTDKMNYPLLEERLNLFFLADFRWMDTKDFLNGSLSLSKATNDASCAASLCL